MVTTPPPCCVPAIRGGLDTSPSSASTLSPRLVNEERGLLGFTGTFEGAPISVQSTGMGCPSSGIVFEELVQLGARRLIRVGTCGAIGDGVAFGDVVIALSATCDDTTPLRYAGLAAYAPTATLRPRRVGRPCDQRRRRDCSRRSDRDQRRVLRPGRNGRWAVAPDGPSRHRDGGGDALHDRRGRRVEALAMLTVSDLVGEGTSERIDDDALRRNIDMLLRIACRVAVR